MNERLAVVGAGLAGLSLALRLQNAPEFRGHVTLYEARDAYADDRRWSFWPLCEHPFAALQAMRCPSLRFTVEAVSLQIDCRAMPYTSLAAGDVYADALAQLAGDDRFSIRLGTRVHTVRDAGDHVLVENTMKPNGEDQHERTDQSHVDRMHEIQVHAVQVHADQVHVVQANELHTDADQTHAQHASARFDRVFDGRMPAEAWRFTQWFTGAELALPRGVAMPEPRLMDFDIRRPGEIAFAYVLPQADDRVLVQLTWFLPHGVSPPADARARWAQYATASLGLDPAAIVREESGALPMHPFPAASKPFSRVHSIGTAAGWVRASTGYGFLDTQRAAARLAAALCTTDAHARDMAIAAVRPRAAIDDRLDVVLLDAMRADPDAVAGWFLRLFQRCPPLRAIRFLSGEASATDRLAIMTALPPMPFLRAALRTRGGRA